MTMTLVVCSLISSGSQAIAPNVYTPLRFPFDSESADAFNLHDKVQPDTGETVTVASPRAALIWPAHTAWATLNGLMYWEDDNYTELRTRFVRDPLNLTTGEDSTCTEDHAPTVGGQYIAKNWNMFVHPNTPVGLLVKHNATTPVAVTFAEFKLSYWVDL